MDTPLFLDLAPWGLIYSLKFCLGAYSRGRAFKIFLVVDQIPVEIFLLKPSAHSTIFVAGNKGLLFRRQRRKRTSGMLDIEDRRQRQKSLMFVSRPQQVFVASDKNLCPQRQKSCCEC